MQTGTQGRLARLARRHRLAGQRRVVRAQAELLDHAGIGRDVVAFGQDQEIPGHERLRFDLKLVPVAQDPGVRRQQFAERFHRLLGAVLLQEGEGRVQQDDDPDHDPERGSPAEQS